MESGIEDGGAAALPRPRLLVPREDASTAGEWRDDLRLFGLTWAAGFIFFLLLIV